MFMKRGKGNIKKVWFVVLIVVICVFGILVGYYMVGYFVKKFVIVD